MSARTSGTFSVTPRLIIILIIVAIVGFIAFNAFYFVDQTEEAVVLTFGKYSRSVGPGLQFKIPFVEESYIVPTRIVQTMDFGFRPANTGVFGLGGNLNDAGQPVSYKNESTMLTGDLNIVDITWIIQYRITDPRQWLFNLDAKEKTIRDITQSVVNQQVGDRAILDILGTDRLSIESNATAMINSLFRKYNIGVFITNVQLKDIMPPAGAVKKSFDDVNVAFQDMNRLINEGQQNYNQQIPKASGEAQQMIQEAEGYAAERVNNAIGDVARFNSVLAVYRQSPRVTRERIYLETMQKIFSNSGDTDLIDKKLSNFLPLKYLGNRAPALAPAPEDTPQSLNPPSPPTTPGAQQ